jgi:hypothetical protein
MNRESSFLMDSTLPISPKPVNQTAKRGVHPMKVETLKQGM